MPSRTIGIRSEERKPTRTNDRLSIYILSFLATIWPLFNQCIYRCTVKSLDHPFTSQSLYICTPIHILQNALAFLLVSVCANSKIDYTALSISWSLRLLDFDRYTLAFKFAQVMPCLRHQESGRRGPPVPKNLQADFSFV